MNKKRIICCLLICSLTCSSLTGCSFQGTENSLTSFLQEGLDRTSNWLQQLSDLLSGLNPVDPLLEDDEEPIFLGDATIGGVDLAEGEVGYIG